MYHKSAAGSLHKNSKSIRAEYILILFDEYIYFFDFVFPCGKQTARDGKQFKGYQSLYDKSPSAYLIKGRDENYDSRADQQKTVDV
jgi:hypothetical protein